MSRHIAHVATATSVLALRRFDLKVNYNGVERRLESSELKGISLLLVTQLRPRISQMCCSCFRISERSGNTGEKEKAEKTDSPLHLF